MKQVSFAPKERGNKMTLGSIYKKQDKYEYILSGNELYKQFAEARAEAYALRKEIKRNRYIYNAEGMQSDIEKIVIGAIINTVEEMEKVVCDDISSMLEEEINGIIQSGNSTIVLGKTKKHSNVNIKLARLLAKEIVKGIANVIEDTVKDN